MGHYWNCARCVVDERLFEFLVCDRVDATLAARLALKNALRDVERPASSIVWLRNPQVQELLSRLGNGDLAFTHHAFDALPRSRAVEHLRAILVNVGVLPWRDPAMASFEGWVDEKLTAISSPAARAEAERFARWHLLPRIRKAVNGGAEAARPARSAKQELTETIKMLEWIDTKLGVSIDQFSSLDAQHYLTTGTSTRSHARNYLQWRKSAGLPAPATHHRTAQSRPFLGEQTALDLLAAALRDDSIHASDKVAALCVLYFGQPVARIVEVRIADIGVAADGVSVQFSEDPLPLPEVIAPVFLAAIDDRRSSRGVNGDSPWLFPSTRAGQHVSHETMLKRLRMIGIDVQAVHNDVLDGLLRAAPPALLARALGYSASTLEAREHRAGHGYASYAADIARRSRQAERRGRGR